MFHVKQWLVCVLPGLVLAMGWTGIAKGEIVRFPGPDLELAAHEYRPAGPGPFPAVVMLHGCSGLLDGSGNPTRSYVFWAEHFRALGYTALLVDSFSPRGQREICTRNDRTIRPDRQRRADALAALVWLAGRPDIDAQRIHLLGWSNGGVTVLHAIKPTSPNAESSPAFRSAVAYYPGCAQLLRSGGGYPRVPLLIQAGAEDDWTPARYCVDWADRARAVGAPVEIDNYPGALHGFDRRHLKPRFRPEVRNPNSPTGWGATVGGQLDAHEVSIARTTTFIQEHNR